MNWLIQILIALDQLANTLVGGWADESLSSRAHRADRKGTRWGRITRPLIDALFFWQPGHCELAWAAEMKRLQFTPAMRDQLKGQP